jgi:alanine racemase
MSNIFFLVVPDGLSVFRQRPGLSAGNRRALELCSHQKIVTLIYPEPEQGNLEHIMDQHFVWAEIDLAAVAHNIRELRRVTRPQARLMAAVKANGYGHGAAVVARTALAHGATDLGVARIGEGIDLRRAGIGVPILVFGHTPGDLAPQMVRHRLTACVSSVEGAGQLNASVPAGEKLAIHLKVDTGMGRLGIRPDQGGDGVAALDEVRAIARFERLELQGLWTHFASSDEGDKSYAQRQLETFNRFAGAVESLGIDIACRHCANSGAIIDMPETHMDMVRAGISVYGLYPSAEVDRRSIDLRPVMTLKARIVHLKRVPAGTPISYGSTWRSPGPTVIATVPVGYGDGYSRSLSNRGEMLVRGRRAPIAGRVCMDLTMIDVGKIDGTRAGDEVVLIGRQGDEAITAEQVAAAVGTINYEITTGLTSRVPRIVVNAPES